MAIGDKITFWGQTYVVTKAVSRLTCRTEDGKKCAFFNEDCDRDDINEKFPVCTGKSIVFIKESSEESQNNPLDKAL